MKNLVWFKPFYLFIFFVFLLLVFMNFRFFFLVFIVLFSFSVFGVSELVFSDLGYESVVFDSLEEHCVNLEFLNDFNSFQRVGFLSLNFSFVGQQNSVDSVKVFFNDSLIDSFSSNQLSSVVFSNNSFTGWRRIFISNELVREKNVVKVCVTPSNSNPRISFLNSSKIGFYDSPLFRKDSFEMKLIGEPVVGKDVLVEISLKNFGSEPQLVSVNYRKNELEHRTPWVKFVSGKSSFVGVVPACSVWGKDCVEPGVKKFSYIIRIGKVGELSLLPAILNYHNFFGEDVNDVESNRLYLDVVPPKIELVPFIQVPRTVFSTGEQFFFKIIVKNTGLVNAQNIELNLNSNLSLNQTLFDSFDLNAGEEKEFTVTAFSSTKGEKFVECNAMIKNYGLNFNCNKTKIVFQEPETPIQLIASIILAIIAITALIYFYFKKTVI